MKVLITVTFVGLVEIKQKEIDYCFACSFSDFPEEEFQPGYPITLRAWGKEADTLFHFAEGDKILVYGSLWSKTKRNAAWIDVDFVFQSAQFINHFFAIGKVGKNPFLIKGESRFSLAINRAIQEKHYYSIASVGNAAQLAESALRLGDVVSVEGYITLVNWTDAKGFCHQFLKFSNTILKQY